MSTPEGRVKAKLKRRLADYPDVYQFWPVQNGMGAPGLDCYLCVNGLFVAVETKADKKKLTPRQEYTAGNILKAKGRVFIVRDDETLNVFMEYVEWVMRRKTHVDE